MISPRQPIDAVFMATSAMLVVLAILQWTESDDFAEHARPTDAVVIELRTTRKQVLEADAETYARVEFETAAGEVVRTELPTPFRASGAAVPAEGSRLAVWYDPRSPRTARLGKGAAREGALVLLALAAGALFAPAILRRALRSPGAGG